jgi:hypothetical protein
VHEGRRRRWRAAGAARPVVALIALGVVWFAWPVPAAAVGVTFEPPGGRPGTTVSIPGGVCGYADELDQVWFSERHVPQSPDSIYDVEPAATAALTPVGGEPTEWGIFNATAQTFVVPRLPAGEYYLYAACWDASACCVPLEPTFHVLGAPDTSTEGGSGPDATGAQGTWRFVIAAVAGLAAGVLALNSCRFGGRPAQGRRASGVVSRQEVS